MSTQNQQNDNEPQPEGKIINCACCPGIHPNDAPCKPWDDGQE